MTGVDFQPSWSLTGKTRRFLRSISLERDFGDLSTLKGYTLTPQVRQVLARVEEGLRPHATERAFTLTGPYGTGKSAFALFLAYLLEAPGMERNPAWALLAAQDPHLTEGFTDALSGRGLLPVPLSLRRAPLAFTLLHGLVRAVGRLPKTKSAQALLRVLKEDLQHGNWDSISVMNRLQALVNVTASLGRYQGVLLILDELGKTLEYATRHPTEDIYVLQQLAELASRSGEHPLVVVGVLHQAFEQYGEHLNLVAQQEWAKVQGRFSNIAFLEPPEQQLRLAVQAIASLELPGATEWKGKLANLARCLVEIGYVPQRMNPDEFINLAAAAYPLHPTALVALPHLFRRFAQNERSLFAYLVSQEPFGLQDLLSRCEPGRLVRLSDLFDYFMANLGGSLVQKPFARRWLEVADALERVPNLVEIETQLLKALGLLNILGEVSFLQATRELVALALADDPKAVTVEAALQSLMACSLVIFRRFNQTFRVWEGSDVDIEARLEAGRYKTAGQSLVDSLQRFLPYRPLVARRHSHEFGALRFFEVRYLDEPSEAENLIPERGVDGVIACCLPSSLAQAQEFFEWAKSEKVAAQGHLLVVLPQEVGTLQEAAAELRALHWVWGNSPELRDDRVARRELAERIALVEQALSQAIHNLLDPRVEPRGSRALWFYRGEEQPVRTPGDATILLSRVMDALYPFSPRIKNELINRRTLSSAAAAARRNLIERMFMQGDQPLLGIKGFPPERSIYQSALLTSGLHREENGVWVFGPPPVEDPLNLKPVWDTIAERISSAVGEPFNVARLFDELSRPPYGVMPGVLPLLLTGFMLAYPDYTSLYREGLFIPDVGVADLEVLMRCPELFAVAGVRVRGERQAVVERIARGLGVKPAVLPVVRALIRGVKSLPNTAWRTRQLPKEVLDLREAFDRAMSPERLLFVEIPLALGELPLSEDMPEDPERIERFFIKLNTALQTWNGYSPSIVVRARDQLLSACGLPVGLGGWHELRALGRLLDGKALHPQLVPFVKRLNDPGDEQAVLESIIALVAGKPPKSWNDVDAEHFVTQTEVIGNVFRQARYLATVLTLEEERQSEQLIEQIKEWMGNNIPRHVLRAALARLLQEV